MFKDLHELLFEELEEPYHFKIGMRMVKTALAVFVCAIIGWLRGQTTFFAMVAAILCMQKSTERAVYISFNRLVGTAVGGIYGVLVLFLETYIHAQSIMPLYYLVISVMLIPVICTAVAMRKPSAAAFSSIVFLSTTIHHVGEVVPYDYALNRLLDTIVGIIVSLIINLTIVNPEHRRSRRAVKANPVETGNEELISDQDLEQLPADEETSEEKPEIK